MLKRKVSKAQIIEERNPKKIQRVIKQKGYPSGKLPRGKILHHINPVAERGKTTNANTRVIPKQKHIQIHKNRKKRGRI